MDHSNEYTKNEDELLWEIHEARHGILNEIDAKGIELFNKEIKTKFKGFIFIENYRNISKKKIG